MNECYCAQIHNGSVLQVIVCDNEEWASANLGGQWICTHERLVGIGWPLVDGKIVEPTQD